MSFSVGPIYKRKIFWQKNLDTNVRWDCKQKAWIR